MLSQEIVSGTVYSAKDSTRLAGVSVYFDGTSIGTVTNEQGIFRIEAFHSAEPLLVISFIGYKTKLLVPPSSGSKELPPVYLVEKQEELPEVLVENDPWSRERKLNIFRREFLGSSSDPGSLRIKNEEVLRLRYIPSVDMLVAQGTEPLILINRHLGYEVRYDLKTFEVQFQMSPGGLRLVHMVFYEGLSFFEELRKNPRKKFLKNRDLAYKGSSLHFMRSLKDGNLQENDFKIFHDKFEVPPYRYFDLQQKDDLRQVKLLTDKLVILYRDLIQSSLQATAPFYIDSFGNHAPPSVVVFGGDMGEKRIGELLPLDYGRL